MGTPSLRNMFDAYKYGYTSKHGNFCTTQVSELIYSFHDVGILIEQRWREPFTILIKPPSSAKYRKSSYPLLYGDGEVEELNSIIVCYLQSISSEIQTKLFKILMSY